MQQNTKRPRPNLWSASYLDYVDGEYGSSEELPQTEAPSWHNTGRVLLEEQHTIDPADRITLSEIFHNA